MALKNKYPPIIGTYNGINYYIQDGKQRQRKAGGGFTAESIKNNPNMQGIRDGNKEWALCSKFNKDFKMALFPFINELNDGTLHSRLMKLFLKIRNLDESPVGQRTVGNGLKTEMGKKLLREFKFIDGYNAGSILGPASGLDTKTGVFKANNFNHKRLRFPKSCTHFSIDYGVLEYNMKTNLFRFILSDNTVMLEKEDETKVLVLDIPEKPKRGRQVFGIVKVQLYYKSMDRFYKSYAKGSVGIGVV